MPRVLGSGLLSLLLGLGFLHAAGPSGYRGRPLAEVLRELQSRGVEVIFSTAVVREDLLVTVEPQSADPRAMLEEILEPLGLDAQDGPGGSILVVDRQQRTGSFQGRVLLALRRTPVQGAVVHLLGTDFQAISAADGSFEIQQVPAGKYRAEVRAPGLQTSSTARVRIPQAAARPWTIELLPDPILVTEIVVTPGRHSVIGEEQAAQHTIEKSDALLVPTIGGDVSRVIERLPGIAASDSSAAFNVRGSVAQDFSIVLDGLELYSPFHLAGFQSPFTLIDGTIVDRMELYAGGFTAELGDRHGGFVEISTAVPEDRGHGEVELGTLNSRVSYQAPMSQASASWLVSARGWYPEALGDSVELGGGERTDPRFWDLYGKVAIAVSPRTLLSVHSLFSYDRLEFAERGEDAESANTLTRSGYLWLRALNAWTPQLTSETVLSGGSIDRPRGGVSAPQEDAFVVDDERVVNFLGLKHDSIWLLSDSHVLKAGIDARFLEAAYRYAIRPVVEPEAATSIRLDPDGTSFAAYAAHRVRLSSAFATEVGLRWDRQTYTGDNQLSPRLNGLWQMSERSELRVGLGRFNQSQRIHELRVEDEETTFFPAEVSEQAELTFQHRTRGGLQLRLDAYYRRLSDLRPRYENLFQPLELFPETGEDRRLVPAERARLRGVELLLRGDADRPLAWWVSYALSSAEDVIDGGNVPRSWDQPQAFKFLVGYRPDPRWSVSLAGTAHTGWPTTPATGEITTLSDGTTEVVRVPGERNSARFDVYARLDLKARRSFALERGRLSFTLDVVNLTDRRNACCVDEIELEEQEDGSLESRRVLDYWLGITPSFGVLWEF